MAIKKIKLSNFKSFRDLEIELGNFNVLIGANASGKSNFIQIFKFLRDITSHGLDNAISMQGGVEYLRSISIGSSENFSLEIVYDQEIRYIIGREKNGGKRIGIAPFEEIYKFSLRFKGKGSRFEIADDKLTHKCKLIKLTARKKGLKEEELGEGEATFSNLKRKVIFDLHPAEGVKIDKNDIDLSPFIIPEKLPLKTILLENPFFYFLSLRNILADTSIYDFDPKMPKKAVPITGKAELEEDGSNLTLVLKNIIGNKNNKRKFSNLIKDVLPFVENLGIEKFADKSLLFKLKEKYFPNQYLPASLISDGTINITALIVTLYFEEKELTIIEEPERNIHPYLISKVIDMMKEASQKKQILITTHNPEIVKHADLEDILLLSRDKDGFSTITRPSDNKAIQTFLEHEMGIEELYVKNMLSL